MKKFIACEVGHHHNCSGSYNYTGKHRHVCSCECHNERYELPSGVMERTTHDRIALNARAESVRAAHRLVRRGWDGIAISDE